MECSLLSGSGIQKEPDTCLTHVAQPQCDDSIKAEHVHDHARDRFRAGIVCLRKWKDLRLTQLWHLWLFHPGVFPSQQALPPPPSAIANNAEEWEVERIKDSCFSFHQLQYSVHWKGYDIYEDTWEPATHLKHVPKLVAMFHQQYYSKLKPQWQSLSCAHDSLGGGNVTNILLPMFWGATILFMCTPFCSPLLQTFLDCFPLSSALLFSEVPHCPISFLLWRDIPMVAVHYYTMTLFDCYCWVPQSSI